MSTFYDDEIWVRYTTPERKKHPKQWIRMAESYPEKTTWDDFLLVILKKGVYHANSLHCLSYYYKKVASSRQCTNTRIH